MSRDRARASADRRWAAKPKTYYRATLETKHFSFEAFDHTPSQAIVALVEAIKRHAAQYNVSPDDMVRDYRAAIECKPFTIGTAYRDREEL